MDLMLAMLVSCKQVSMCPPHLLKFQWQDDPGHAHNT